jgi:hypothetical protein
MDKLAFGIPKELRIKQASARYIKMHQVGSTTVKLCHIVSSYVKFLKVVPKGAE